MSIADLKEPLATQLPLRHASLNTVFRTLCWRVSSWSPRALRSNYLSQRVSKCRELGQPQAGGPSAHTSSKSHLEEIIYRDHSHSTKEPIYRNPYSHLLPNLKLTFAHEGEIVAWALTSPQGPVISSINDTEEPKIDIKK